MILPDGGIDLVAENIPTPIAPAVIPALQTLLVNRIAARSLLPPEGVEIPLISSSRSDKRLGISID
jgi:hypothetical protein